MLLIRTTHGFILLNINRLICCYLRLPTFTVATTRFTTFDGSLAPKVVQIIESYNKLYAFFVIFRVFGGFFEIYVANFGLWACCSPTAEGCASLRASCSPPQWGGGELRDSKSRNTYYNILSGSSLRRSRTSVKRVAGLRWREAAARATLRVAIPQFFGSQ